MTRIWVYMQTIDWAHGIGAVLGAIWRGTKSLLGAVVKSVAAFVASPQVWAAAALFAFLGFCGGFLLMEPKVHSLNVQARGLAADLKTASDKVTALAAENVQLAGALKKLQEGQKPAPEAQPAPAAKSPPAATPAPVTAKRKPKPAQSGTTAWW